jgi:hypothetical protein
MSRTNRQPLKRINRGASFIRNSVLNDRGIKSPTGKAWQSVTVLRLVERVKGESRP